MGHIKSRHNFLVCDSEIQENGSRNISFSTLGMSLEEERIKYAELFNREDMKFSVEYYKDIYVFLLQSKHLLSSFTDFAKEMRSKLVEKLSQNKFQPIYPILHELIKKIDTILNKQANQVPIPKNLQYVAKGSFGCVVKPALPNTINSKWKQYPDDVSKIFFQEDMAVKAKKNANMIYNTLHNRSHIVEPYSYKYDVSTLPDSIQNECKLSNYSGPIYVTRMANLGISINAVQSYIKEFRKIPVGIIIEQCLKLFTQVKTMYEKGYVHGDIRETNVMANPETGVLTLIDFDWFYPKDVFFSKYSTVGLGFYSNPPESLLYSQSLPLSGKYLQFNEDVPYEKLEEYVKNSHIGFRKDLTVQQLRSANSDNIAYLRNIQNIEEFYEILFPTFDSYGLGIAILDFLYKVYPKEAFLQDVLTDRGRKYNYEEFQIVKNTIHDVFELLLSVVSLRIRNRLSIDDAEHRLRKLNEDYVENMKYAVPIPSQKRKARKTRKARKARGARKQ